MGAWLELLRSAGQAFLAVLQAELVELGSDLKRSGRHLLRAMTFFSVAAFLGFWAVMVLFYFLFQLLSLWLHPVAATGLVLGLFLLSMGILGFLGYRQLKKCESPAQTLQRHLEDHTTWWSERLLPPEGPRPSPEGSKDGAWEGP